MARLPLKSGGLIVAGYATVGLALGLLDPSLGRLAELLGMRPGVGTAVSVNLLMPLAAVVLGLLHARLSLALVGAMTMTLAFAVGLAAHHAAPVRTWSPATLLASIPPVLVFATLGYAVLGSISAWAMQARRAPLRGRVE